MDFNLNYVIPDNGMWFPHYANDTMTVEILLKQYAEYKARIKFAYDIESNKDYFTDYTEFHQQQYLLETLIGEGNIDGSTTIDEVGEILKNPDQTKKSIKINNLNDALQNIFPNIFSFLGTYSKVDVAKFTPEFIQETHKLVTKRLLDNSGIYRTKMAAPSQEHWFFLIPSKIRRNLEVLCEITREELHNEAWPLGSWEDVLLGRIKIAATFLTQFLQIHPFSNGNGRVGRLLVSWLMADLSIVPVPILTNKNKRSIYLECLRDARLYSPILPTNLARLILESVIHAMRTICHSLDI